MSFRITDYKCHLKQCPSELASDPEGCIALDNDNVLTYKDQLKRDYPSYSQIRKIINDNSKSCLWLLFLAIARDRVEKESYKSIHCRKNMLRRGN